MSRKRKKSKAVPVVLLITLVTAAVAVLCFLIRPLYSDPIRKAAADRYAADQARIDQENQQIQNDYNAAVARAQSEHDAMVSHPANPAWPEHKTEGWDVIDLTNYPLENQTAISATRQELMSNGMLLLNEWHSRPDDFDESKIVSVGKHLGGNTKVQVHDYNVSLFPVACDALMEAIEGARAEGLEHYIVEEGYRTWDAQNSMFQKRVEKLSSRYSGDALIAAAKKEVNYPGTSEFNSGLAFTLRLYDKKDPEVAKPKYSTTEQGIWMNRNCWKYGLVFRFPLSGWPLPETQDKSFKTGVSVTLNLYRYVGKGNAAVMHYYDFCLEEYIEYLQEHPHIAVFENNVLKYEIYRQYVGDAQTFNLQLTRNAKSYQSSLDNMGAVITVFEY